ncbi:MAG: glycosyltransferase family 1 protein [Meiothermus sp.]|nr:glycosyltransferase family 1 protein [Meiothermus sp.]
MNYDLVCVSHLRWDLVFQRPQHLMTRAAKGRKVIYWEEPVFAEDLPPHLETRRDSGVLVATPHLPTGLDEVQVGRMCRQMLDGLLADQAVERFVLWMYSPMPLYYLGGLKPQAVVYDCMDELANFRFAPPILRQREKQLFERADIVFTGGVSLYEAKCAQNPNVHCFPSSVEVEHFAKARRLLPEPHDLQQLRHPRAGFYGVIDERMDLELLDSCAERMPEVEFVLVGPLAKIDPSDLPERPNLHFLGRKTYAELPAYLAHWDVALLPFTLNESTRFISPTKTPEYLAAGKPVVSTSIKDVVRPYGEAGVVYIANGPDAFCRALRKALSNDQQARQVRADALISGMSWDNTWQAMQRQLERTIANKQTPTGTAPREAQHAPSLGKLSGK